MSRCKPKGKPKDAPHERAAARFVHGVRIYWDSILDIHNTTLHISVDQLHNLQVCEVSCIDVRRWHGMREDEIPTSAQLRAVCSTQHIYNNVVYVHHKWIHVGVLHLERATERCMVHMVNIMVLFQQQSAQLRAVLNNARHMIRWCMCR
jgi:hypothetical protein